MPALVANARGCASTRAPSAIGAVFALLASMCFAAPLGAAGPQPGYSGFLGEEDVYARLQPVELRQGEYASRWLAEDLARGFFGSVLVDPVMFYPEALPGPQVDAATLEAVREYLDAQLRARVGEVLKIADAPGSGVLRVQTAITGVSVEAQGPQRRGMPLLGALFSGNRGARGTRAAGVRLFVEARFHDSATGRLLGVGMRELDGGPLADGTGTLRLEDLRPAIDEAAEDAALVLHRSLTVPAAVR
jgi:hypothetical protein